MFTRAIVKRPGKSMTNGLTTAGLGSPDHETALIQHDAYIDALKQCGLTVTILDADERYPDSTFVEDAALLTPACAIITRPGAESRQGETLEIKEAVSTHYEIIEEIVSPGTVDGGDVMMMGAHYFIGLSERTNETGAAQLVEILKRHGMTGSTLPLSTFLHLKSGVSYLENDNLLVAGEFIQRTEFEKFNRIVVGPDETYAANAVWINGRVLIAKGFPNTRSRIESSGYETIVLNVSEFRKLDGGLSCLSLRF